jgi:hypothetical protein
MVEGNTARPRGRVWGSHRGRRAERFARFGLALHPEKTRLIRFQRPSPRGGGPRPGSFDFLGFTFYWGRSRRGRWVLKEKTAKSRFSRATRTIGQWMRRARHLPVKVQAEALGQKLRGHYNYYGIQGNARSLGRFHHVVIRLWRKWLWRRSQRARMSWKEFYQLLKHHPLPPVRLPRHRRQLRLANL